MKKKFLTVLTITLLITLTGCRNQSDVLDKFIGQWTDTGYINEELNFSFVTPEGAVLATPSELAELEAARTSGLTQEQINQLHPMRHVLFATFPDTNVSVYVQVEYLRDRDILDINLYLDNVEYVNSQNQMFELVFHERYPARIAGQEYLVLPIEIRGTNFIQMVYVRQEGYYIISFILVYDRETEHLAVDLLRAFQALETE